MKPLPDTENPILLRSDFSDDTAWKRLCALVASPIGRDGFKAHMAFVDDPGFAEVTLETLRGSISGGQGHSFIVIADDRTFSEPEQPLLVMDCIDEPGRTFRALPTRIQAIENNLSIGNMGFAEFADAADENGVFRGFPGETGEDYSVNHAPRTPVPKKPSGPKTLLGRALFYTYKVLRGKPGT